MKKNLNFTVAIVWKSQAKMKLRTSIYSHDDDGVKNNEEALGKAIADQKKALDNPEDYTMAMHNTSATWQEVKKPDLSCLRYC